MLVILVLNFIADRIVIRAVTQAQVHFPAIADILSPAKVLIPVGIF